MGEKLRVLPDTHPVLDAGCLQGNGGSLGSDYLQGLSALCS